MQKWFYLSLLPTLLLAQQSKPSGTRPDLQKAAAPAQTEAALSAMQKQIVELSARIDALQKEVKKHDSWFQGRDTLARIYQEKVDSAIHESVSLDPSLKGYGTITTSSGTFFIRLTNVEPYLDGYRIALDIGNPYAITYTDISVSAEWNRKIPKDIASYEDWLRTKREQEFSESIELKPAGWTPVRLVLKETKSDQLGYLEIKLTAAGVRMSN